MKRTKMAKMKKMKMEKMMKFVKMPSHRENETLVEKREMKRVKRKEAKTGQQRRTNAFPQTHFPLLFFSMIYDLRKEKRRRRAKKSI